MAKRLTKDQLERRRASGRERARRWKEAHVAEFRGLQVIAEQAAIDRALVDALIVVHLERRDASGDRDAPVALRDVVRTARELLAGDGTMPELDAHSAIRVRLRVGALTLPGTVAVVPPEGLFAAA